MEGFLKYSEVIKSCEYDSRNYVWRKTPNQVTTLGVWFDMSSSAGNPLPKYWFDSTPLISKAVRQSTDGGLFHGGNVSPKSKYLHKLMIGTTNVNVPMSFILCDYLLYYPTIGEDTTDEQFLTNLETLPRYTDGEGIQIMALSVAARTGGQNFIVNYTNSQGVSGRVTPPISQNGNAVLGSCVSSNRVNANATGAFLTLQQGDTGVRSIESITMQGIDVGLFSLILVKPLVEIYLRETGTPAEIDYFFRYAPIKIEDDAFLSLVGSFAGSVNNAVFLGTIKTIIK